MCVPPCQVGAYRYWNESCAGYCNFPLQTNMTATVFGNVYQCVYPCQSNQYLFWDGMCENDCPSPPLTNDSVYIDRRACSFRCNTDANPIVYWDGTCNNTCAFPLFHVVEHQRAFCYHPCNGNDYLYTNGSCLPTCQQDFINSPFKGKNFEQILTYPIT